MSTEPQEYTDEQTGIRLIVERDYPVSPRLTMFAPLGNTLSTEEVSAALSRLLIMADMKPKEQENE